VTGSGGIGGFIATHAALAGHDVTLCVRTPLDTLVVESAGEVLRALVRIATRPDGLGPPTGY
jgi:2-dehydropantoate 2-reductase